MTYDFTALSIAAEGEICEKAAKLFAEEIFTRTGNRPNIYDSPSPSPCLIFRISDNGSLPSKDSYQIELENNNLILSSPGLRGLIFSYSYFLRKTVYDGEKIELIKDIGGKYIPSKKIRGHQLGYRTTPNTYDAWSYGEYHRYYLDMMYFGANTCEQMPTIGPEQRRNWLMKHDIDELLVEVSRLADELDMDVSLWYPNDDDESMEASLERRRKLFERVPRIDAVFPPGGDPGEYDADEFLERCVEISKVLKSVHPKAEMWPSAQKPHSIPDWGETFMNYIQNLPPEIDGVITGPNRAFTLDELRRRLPLQYPIRFYPDITHNVRCEHPVHFNLDDWHYAYAATSGRESINPRPVEYRLLHRMTRRYIVGSVSYSEGVNDDINKMVWSDLDFFPDISLNETLQDYARVFMPGTEAKKVANGILGLELNWQGDPAENPHVESTLRIWQELLEEKPDLIENWRFVSCLFRAECDALVRRRRIFENELLDDAKHKLSLGKFNVALEILETDFSQEYKDLRADIFTLGDRLFRQIGLQLDVENYGADSPDRGAVLDTIDQPVTDRLWLLNSLKKASKKDASERSALVQRLLNRYKVSDDEYYYSLAEHGLDVLGVRQEGEIYIDFQGDRVKVNNGNMPMGMLKLYDNYSFRCKLGGFTPGQDYKLRITFSSKKIEVLKHHKILANGVTIYEGPQYGGERDLVFDDEMLCPGFESASYRLPADIFVNGCLELVFSEPIAGVKLSEFWIIKA